MINEKMAPLLPSEVARLVYGQLERCNCSSVAERFLDQSPNLEECRDFVKKFSKPSFMTKAYGLTLQQILERYLDMWNLILDRTNELIPNSQDKFADPVDAFKFLFSTCDKTSNELENIRPLTDDIRWKPVIPDEETSSIFSLRGNSSPDTVCEIPNENLNLSHSLEAGCTRSDSCENDEVAIVEQTCIKKQASSLDKLYASTENAQNSGERKKLKMLKPRLQFFNRSAASNSVFQNSTVHTPLLENKVANFEANHNTKETVTPDKNCESFETSSAKVSKAHLSKQINMQLRSSRRISDAKNRKVSKKRKCCSPVRESGSSKLSKMTKSIIGKENDARVDFTKIPQLLIDDPKWPEIIAENINKKIMESPQKKIVTLVEDGEIQSIAEKTVEDNLTDEFIRGLLDCAQTTTEEKISEMPVINLLDNNPYETNANDDGVINRGSSSTEATGEPFLGYSSSSDPTYRNASYTNLQEDMNEFMRFNCTKGDNIISQEQSGVIFLDMAETELISTQNCDNYVIEGEKRSVHSSYVVCSIEQPSVPNGSNLNDEIITLNSDMNNVEWNVTTGLPITISAARKICEPATSPRKVTRLRPIAPKPKVSVITASSNEIILPSNSKNSRKSRK